jgi:hypothetical protein
MVERGSFIVLKISYAACQLAAPVNDSPPVTVISQLLFVMSSEVETSLNIFLNG